MSQAVQHPQRHLSRQRSAVLAALGAAIAAGAVAIVLTTGGEESTSNSVAIPPAPVVQSVSHPDESGVANAITPSQQSRPDESDVGNAITPSEPTRPEEGVAPLHR
jgi:hypothetical protein